MPKRKDDAAAQTQKPDNDLEALPIPIQSFLWRQLSPFVRPYARKLQETSCVSFERVVVQNILHGLSPSLSDAIESIPRWRFIVASLPYVLHCCASSLESRTLSSGGNGPGTGTEAMDPLGPNATKLLYTLHWILLDAAAECADQERERERLKSVSSATRSTMSKQSSAPNEPYLLPITSLQVFVYLFAPLLPHLRSSDFGSFRLENGLKIWQPLWEYRQPDIPCFTAPVKPNRSTDTQPEEVPHAGVDVGDIYVGIQQDVGFLLDEPERNAEEQAAAQEAIVRAAQPPGLQAPLVHMSEICTLTTLETPVTPQLELICEFCNTKVQAAEKDVFRCKCGHRRRRPAPLAPAPPLPPLAQPSNQLTTTPHSIRDQTSPVDKEFLQNKLDIAITSQISGRARDISAATYFDIAVLRCLYVPPWTEEGMFWGLRYFLHRMVEVRDYLQRTSGLRQRSNSVPSVTSSSKSRNQSPKHEARSLSPSSKRNQKPDYLIPLERRASRRRRGPFASMEESPKFFIGGEDKMTPPVTPGIRKLQDNSFSFGGFADTKRSGDSPTTLKRGFVSSSRLIGSKEKASRRGGKSFPKITITTENSPSHASVIEEDLSSSHEFERIDTELESDPMGIPPVISATLTRSKTDSNIAYPLLEYQEARGASNLIHDEGELNYQALIRAVLVALNERPSQRICDVALSLLDVLLDVLSDTKPGGGNISNTDDHEALIRIHSHTSPTTPTQSTGPLTVVFHDVVTHRLFMSCITRIFVIVGCAYGCGKDTSTPGRGNPTEYLRRQAHMMFHRLHTINEPEAKKFLRGIFTKQELQHVVDFCHAFFGSCVSPTVQDQTRSSRQTKKSLGWVAALAAKPVITQLMANVDRLKRPENMGLQNDLRSLLSYFKEAHQAIFRRIVMSGVMESQQRQTVLPSRTETPTPVHIPNPQPSLIRRPLLRNVRNELGSADNDILTIESDQENLSSFDVSGPSARTLRGIFAKRVKKSLRPLQSREASETNLNLKVNSIRSPRVSISEDESVDPSSPHGKKKRIAAGFRQRWLKSPKSSMGSKESAKEEGGGMHRSISMISGEGGFLGGETSRQQSIESTLPAPADIRPRLSFRSSGHGDKGVLKRGRFQESSSQEDENPRSRGYLRRAGTSRTDDTPTSVMYILNTSALTSGMRCLGTLLEFCPPGTVPEASVLAAMLDLQAPVLSRASFFFECAQFVRSCNQGKWPEWMKLNSPQYRQSGLIGRLVSAPTPRKQNILQRTAGKVFYEWARSLTLCLDEVMKTENVDPQTVVSPNAALIENEEDFFVLGNDNLEGSGNCPLVLKIAACQLLLEITAFLRETYRILPRQKYGTLRGHGRNTIGGDKRLSNRRWSSVASTSGGTSHQSIQSFVDHGQVHVFQTGHGPNERRISFMIADDTTSQRSGSSGAVDEEKRHHLLKSGRDRAKQHALEGPQARRSSIRRRKASQDMDSRRNRTDSIRSRKASSVSERSDISRSSTEEIATPYDDGREVFGSEESTEYSDNMPWLESIITLCSRLSFVCDHKNGCTVYCFYRIMRSCTRLCWAVRKINGDNMVQPTGAKVNTEEEDIIESRGHSGSQTPTTPSMSHRKLRIFRKSSHHTALNRLSKSATTMEKQGSLESVNKLRHENAEFRDREVINKTDQTPSSYYPQQDADDESNVMAKYIKHSVVSLFAAPLSTLAKGLLILDEKQLERMFPVCWELLLVDDEEVASTAAVLCVVCSVKISKFVIDFLRREMNHEETEERVDSILKFQTLWRYRYQIWIRLEDGAQAVMRVSHVLNIDYTLPSPLIGRPMVDCPDAPWLPPTSIKIEEVAISQEEQSKNSNTLVAATQTRRKQLQESMNKALRAQEERNQRERERVKVTMLPVLKMAAIEPLPHQVLDDREDVDEGAGAAELGTLATHTVTYQPVFPTSLATAVLLLVDLLDDADVDSCGIAVCELALNTLWEGMVEDSALFLRYILEKLGQKDKQSLILRKLRKVLGYMPRLPPQAACTLFNHLLGYCMSYVRNPNENNFNGVEAAMSVMWHIVPSVDGISFKDIKAVLRREQCDAHLLLTANVPGAKKVIVHGPDLTQIPSQIPVNEETQFIELLTESLDFFSIPVPERAGYILTDSKTGRVHHPTGYVRDVYFFRRSYYPQLNLVKFVGNEGFMKLQLQAYHNLFLEAQKIFVIYALFKSAEEKSDSAMQQQQAMVLDDGLTKIPNFPRRALECDVRFQEGPLGDEYLGIDVMHKYAWIQMVSNLLSSLSRPNSEVQLSHTDIQMLFSVLNGVLVLHCQDSATIRLCLATFVNVARNMKHLFATSGFLLIMPTILKIYAAHQTNSMVIEAIEFACCQFFTLHRNPFLLQTFGSAAGLLDLNHNQVETKPLKRLHIKKILSALEKFSRRPSKVLQLPSRHLSNTGVSHPLDLLDMLEQVDTKKPLQPLDFCYQNDTHDATAQTILTSAVSSCIAVIAFDSAESPRGTQMLQVLRTLLNEEVWHEEKYADNAKSAKDELQKIISLAASLKSLIFSCDSLTRPFTVPVKSPTNQDGSHGRSVVMASPSHDGRRDVEAGRPKITFQDVPDQFAYQFEFSAPRNHLLAIVAHYLSSSNARIRHLSKFLGDLATRPPELLDAKSHVRLADVAHTLLKVAAYNKEVMACEGLELYMMEILPAVDFSVESLKAALQNLLRRIEKTFTKISKASSMRKETDWQSASKIIQGLSKTLCNNNLMALMPQLRSITGTCIHLTLGEATSMASDTVLISPIPTHPASMSIQPPSPITVPSIFRDATIDLCSVYLQAGREYCNLEQLCAQFADRFLRLVVCFLLPFVLRIGCGSLDLPPMRIEDLRYILRALVQLLHPPMAKQPVSVKQLSVNTNITRTNSSMSNCPSGSHPLAVGRHQDLSRRVAFLGLKVLVACYEGRLGSEWLRLSKSIQDYGEKGNGGLAFWHFLEYTIVYRTPLFVHLAPFALRILDNGKKDNEDELPVQTAIRSALTGNIPWERSPHVVLVQITQETNNLIEEYLLLTHNHPPSRSPTQIGAEEGSQSESDGVHRLADFARFRYAKRKESVQQDHSSSSQGGKRSPPIVIPVLIERSEKSEKLEKYERPQANSVSGIERKKSALSRQKAQHGEHGHTPLAALPPTVIPPDSDVVNKVPKSEIPEAIEMVQMMNNDLSANINSKVITVSLVHSNRIGNSVRKQSVDSLNDDEKIYLLK